ncbi:MAG: phosphoribosyltransferase family protein [Candidatus Symbiobacter sp.]|nr:phosphoribosyltransferase family protein [Candidatus Symbiobacter sp.]
MSVIDMTETTVVRMDWEEYRGYMDQCLADMKAVDYVPDYMIVLGRGGFYFGDYLTRKIPHLKDRTFWLLASSYYDGVSSLEKQNNIIRMSEHACTLNDLPLTELLRSANQNAPEQLNAIPKLRILICDDMCDGGRTAEFIFNHFYDKTSAVDFRFATVLCKPHSAFKPHFNGRMMPTNDWVRQPFEVDVD